MVLLTLEHRKTVIAYSVSSVKPIGYIVVTSNAIDGKEANYKSGDRSLILSYTLLFIWQVLFWQHMTVVASV